MSRKANNNLAESATPASVNGNVLPKGWMMSRFDEFAQMVNERVDPSNTDAEIYVGLEHLDSGSLKLRRWGSPTDVIGGKLRFQTGDIIFGRRRAYQRKLAVAEFNGICSAHAMVVRAIKEAIIPEFLPFLMQSDMFMNRAVEISVGSLSPTINWKTLRVQKFPLPPKEEQRRIADILWAADEAAEGYHSSYESLCSLHSQLLTSLTTLGIGVSPQKKSALGNIAEHWSVETVESLTSICQYGLSIPLKESGRYPILRMMNYDDGEIVANDLKYVDLDERDFVEFHLERNDILFNRTNSADLVGKVGIFRLEGDYVFASYLVRLRTDTEKVLPEYLNAYLNSDLGQRRLLAYATPGVSQTNISAGSLKRVLVPVPPLEEQQVIVAILEQVRSQKRAVQRHVERTKELKARLIGELLSRSGEL